ncbi:hypothetical protein MHBO_001762 [Bonamia ostreae]|uniref:ESF1 RRM domain-containing protein n=1 Tax=Bonamia ostreae TaxID=126728 RepID=A0ABV2AKL8_9EUKA
MAKKSTESDENVSENTSESDENELKIEKHLTENDENGYENDENKLKMEKKSTNKIAVVKQDWSVLRAVDVLAILSSCLPSRNFIKSVVVYPTKYGLKRMKKV